MSSTRRSVSSPGVSSRCSASARPRSLQRPDARADARRAELEGEPHAAVAARLGEQPLDAQLEVVHLVEAQVRALGDAADDQPHHRAEGARRAAPRSAPAQPPRHRPPADHEVAVHQARRLPRRGPRHLAIEVDAQALAAVRDRAGDPGRRRSAAAPPAPATRPRCSTDGSAATARVASSARGPTTTPVAPRVLRQHVERLGRGHADAAALADGEAVVAAVAAEHAPAAVHHLALPRRRGAVTAHEVGPVAAREEAEVLALALVGHRQARPSGPARARAASPSRRAGSSGGRARRR